MCRYWVAHGFVSLGLRPLHHDFFLTSSFLYPKVYATQYDTVRCVPKVAMAKNINIINVYFTFYFSSLQNCQLEACHSAVISSTHWIVWVFLVLLCVGACVLGVSLWRGCTPLRLGYRRHFTPSLRSTRFSHPGSVRFTKSEESSSAYTNGQAAQAASESGISLSDGSENKQSKLLQVEPELNSRAPGDSQDHSAIRFAKIAKIGGYPAAYHNSIYTTLPEIAPEDEYDPEA